MVKYIFNTKRIFNIIIKYLCKSNLLHETVEEMTTDWKLVTYGTKYVLSLQTPNLI